MTWPFILNTVSLWPSVRKWLLILALNLLPVNVKREAAEVRDEGSWVSAVPPHCAPFHSFSRPSPSSVANSRLLFEAECVSPPHPPTHHHHRTPHPRPPRLQIKATAPLPVCVMGENQSYFYAGPCVTFPLRRYVVARGKGEGLNGDWMVESQPLLPPPKKKKKKCN